MDKKIIVITDSHGNKKGIEKLKSTINYDYLFFCGDGLNDVKDFVNDTSSHFVAGNCDLFFDEALQKDISINNVKFLITHGHIYKAKYTYSLLVQEAKRIGAQVVCFGHTHNTFMGFEDGILLLNPGAFKNNRYIEIIVKDNGEIQYQQLELDQLKT